MKVTVVDYGSGNLRSVAKAFERASGDLGEEVQVVVSENPADIKDADRVVLPGVGAFGDCISGVGAVAGLRDALEAFVMDDARPFMGICVGMQLMADEGVEHGIHKGFGWIGGRVAVIEPSDKSLKIPHMGWNELDFARTHPVLDGLATQPPPHAYFVHSYALTLEDESDLVASTDYGGPVTAMIARDNMIATQFHPEKSQAFGLGLIEGFLKWKP